jgi:CHAT domain-containing protein/tetratricopeptide (TPR) repeat protein
MAGRRWRGLAFLVALALGPVALHGAEPESPRAWADRLRAEGVALYRAGKREEALQRFRETLDALRRVHDGAHAEIAGCQEWIAQTLVDLRRRDEAIRAGREAVATWRALYTGDRRELSDALFRQGMRLIRLCSLTCSDEAIPLLEESLAMLGRLQEGKDSVDRADLLTWLSCALNYAGRHRDSVVVHRREVAMRERLVEGDDARLATAMNSLATGLTNTGHLAEALHWCRRSLAMRRRLFRGDSADLAWSINQTANVLDRLGRPEDAIPLLEEALAMRERLFGAESEHLSGPRMSLGGCLLRTGRPAEALRCFEWALRVLERGEEREPDLVARRVDLGRCHLVVAECLARLSRHREALPHLRRTLELAARLPPSAWRLVEGAERQRGACLWQLGEMEEARSALERAVEVCRAASGDPIYSASQLGLFRLAVLDQPERAVPLFEEAIRRIEDRRFEAHGLSERDRGRYFTELKSSGAYEGMVRALLRLDRPDEALRYLEQARARSLLDLLDRSRFDPFEEIRRTASADADEDLLAEIDAISGKLATCDGEVARLGHALRVTAVRTDLSGEERERRSRELRDRMDATCREQQQVLRERWAIARDRLDLADVREAGAIRKLLVEDERLLVYSVSPMGSLLLVVPPPGDPVRSYGLRWPDGSGVTRETLAGEIDAYLEEIARGRRAVRGLRLPEAATPRRDGLARGSRLFRALIPEKVWDEIRGSSLVRLVPHGPLSRLPFEALVTAREEGRYWLDDGPPIGYGASGSAMLWSEERRAQQERRSPSYEAVALGDPVFRAVQTERDPPARDPEAIERTEERGALVCRFGALEPLPGTRREVEAILAALDPKRRGGRVRTLLAEEATETRLFVEAPKARFLHLATHQIVDETAGASYSSLALTSPATPTPEDDGFLRLIDLLLRWRGRLGGCELVVLSACETRRGEEQADEGVFAMPWGFLYAGTPSVVASLWRVDDDSTAALMGAFYRSLAAGDLPDRRRKLEAFTRARKELRKRHPEPYHWAPFVYIGSPR